DPPCRRRERRVMEEAQSFGMHARISTLEARAADHDIDARLMDIGPDALPKKFDGAAVTIRLEHAGAPELHETHVGRFGRDQGCEVVFPLGVEAVMEIRHVLAQHTVSADDLGAAPASFTLPGAIDHEKMV